MCQEQACSTLPKFSSQSVRIITQGLSRFEEHYRRGYLLAAPTIYVQALTSWECPSVWTQVKGTVGGMRLGSARNTGDRKHVMLLRHPPAKYGNNIKRFRKGSVHGGLDPLACRRSARRNLSYGSYSVQCVRVCACVYIYIYTHSFIRTAGSRSTRQQRLAALALPGFRGSPTATRSPESPESPRPA